jgi:hypothetical protein
MMHCFFNLLRFNACTCSRLIFSPSSGGEVYNVVVVLLVLLKRLCVGLGEEEHVEVW